MQTGAGVTDHVQHRLDLHAGRIFRVRCADAKIIERGSGQRQPAADRVPLPKALCLGCELLHPVAQRPVRHRSCHAAPAAENVLTPQRQFDRHHLIGLVVGRSKQEWRLQEVEQRGAFCTRGDDVEPGGQGRGSAGGRQLPAGLVIDHDPGALQQRADTACRDAVLRHDGDRGLALLEPVDDGLGACLRFVFQTGGGIHGQAVGHCRSSSGVLNRYRFLRIVVEQVLLGGRGCPHFGKRKQLGPCARKRRLDRGQAPVEEDLQYRLPVRPGIKKRLRSRIRRNRCNPDQGRACVRSQRQHPSQTVNQGIVGIELGFPDRPHELRFIGKHLTRRRRQLHERRLPAGLRTVGFSRHRRPQCGGQFIGQGQQRLCQRQQICIAAGGEQFFEPGMLAQFRIQRQEPLVTGHSHGRRGTFTIRWLLVQPCLHGADARRQEGAAEVTGERRTQLLRMTQRRHHDPQWRQVGGARRGATRRILASDQQGQCVEQAARRRLPVAGARRDRQWGEVHRCSYREMGSGRILCDA